MFLRELKRTNSNSKDDVMTSSICY